jgi:GGDEF domain-containing protein
MATTTTDRLVALPTLRFFRNRPDLVFTTAPVFPLTSEPSPCAPPARPDDELSVQQKFDMLLAQLDEFDRIADQLDHGADDSRDKPPQTH